MDKFVIVKHRPQNAKCYLFSVPESMDLFAGDVVVCDNHEQSEAICVCDSFYTPHGEEILMQMRTSRPHLRGILAVRAKLRQPSMISSTERLGCSNSSELSLADLL